MTTEMQALMNFISSVLENKVAQKVIDTLTRLDESMQQDVCHFTYKKANGEIRDAYGTRVRSLIEEHLAEKGMKKTDRRRENDSTTSYPYYDLEKDEWRSFNVLRLLSVDDGYSI